MPPAYMADVRELAEKAPVVFRGRVLTVNTTGPQSDGLPISYATIQVDRQYRGKVDGLVSVRFVYAPYVLHGHYCMDFQPDSYWLVFAVEKPGGLELFDDCEGALEISRLLGRDLAGGGWAPQMEEDFLAGLGDENSGKRIISLQRLGGLKLPSSRGALHQVIENGSGQESKWAMYAALRTGDVSVLPRVQKLLATASERNSPEWAIAFELRNVKERSAVPDLIAILDSTQSEIARSQILIALVEELKDPRAAPEMAAHLSDADPQGRYLAVEGLQNVTNGGDCHVQAGETDQELERHAEQCKVWWEREGSVRDWVRQ